MGLSGRKISVPTVLPTLGTWACMSQALWGGGVRRGCVWFSSPTRLFQNYPHRGTQKPHTSSISISLVPDEELLNLPRPWTTLQTPGPPAINSPLGFLCC